MTTDFTSFQSGRYQVLRKLGEGGKGIVFLCQDTVLSRDVALKVIKEEVLDPEGLMRFQREVQAMGRLMHPNVVTVFDIGEEGGRQYVILELMEGGGVEHLIASSPQKRLDGFTAVRIGKDVSRALDHAHKHGILHRDVKPANIWLTKDGTAKLGDFGLAYLGGSLKITRAGMMVGSVAYMAPEVALGRQADPRSDLYMLGATLYEMVTGRVPFSGDDPVKVIFSHINDLPLSPTRFVSDMPYELEGLILKLLSKDPEQRLKSAGDVLGALEDIEKQFRAAPVLPAAAGAVQAGATRPPSPEPRYAQPLVGRERELTLLKQRVDSALRGEGSLVFITGEAGIGKTRLAWEVRPYARGRGFLWLEGRYLKEGNIPFQPWVEAIRGFVRTASPALLVKVLMPHAPALMKLVPELSERLGALPSLPSIGPDEERTRLFEAVSGFFTAIAREQPLVFFVDDLQWASSLDTLHHLGRSVATERILLVGAFRDIELKESAALARTLLAMNRERLFYTVPLKRLIESEVAQMVTQTFGEAASAKLAEIVNQKTEGNPFFVEEMVRYLTESGAITLGESGWEVKDPALVQLPDSVKAVVGERLERLGEEARAVLTWASVVGREFTVPLLTEVTGLDEDKVLDAIDKALTARVVTPRTLPGQEAFQFVDSQTRDALYEGISAARWRRYHLRVGQAMEKVHARRLEEYYEALAHHFLEGNDLEKAAEYSLKAGDKGSSVYAWERAIGHYQIALELLEELDAQPQQQAEILERLALVTGFGKGKGSVGYLEKALSLYEAIGDTRKAGSIHMRLAQQYGIYEVGAQDIKKGHSHNLKAIALLEPEGISPELGRAYVRLGQMIQLQGHESLSTAIELTEKGLNIAEQLGDTVSVIEASRLLGNVLVSAGELQRALEMLDRSVATARARGALVAFNHGAIMLARAYALLADSTNVLRWAEQAAQTSKAAGAFRQQILSSLVLAWASMLYGNVQQAILNLDIAEQAARKGGTELRRVPGPAGAVPGLVYFFLGDWDKAEAELLARLQTGNEPPDEMMLMVELLGRLYLERGDLVGAKASVREAVNLCYSRGGTTGELILRALLVEIASKGGELQEATPNLQRAREIVSNGEDWRGLLAKVHLAEGILATAKKNWPEAEDAFRKAAEINQKYHLPYYEAKTLFEWGQMYLSRNEPGDRERGMGLLDEALAIFQKIQAKKIVEKVLAHKQVLTA